jgi:long-chain acyl-CoA synthetase
MPSFEVKTIDSEGNQTHGTPGELLVRGAPVIKGYLNRVEATKESITEGWLHTGDVATIDDTGFIFIVDRVKDMVLRGGENIYCSEVESVLFQIDALAECSVFGVPDDRLGEEVGAAIYLKPNQKATPDDIRSFCATLMAKHKIPRYLWILETPLPRNASGKFLKRELRDHLALSDAV